MSEATPATGTAPERHYVTGAIIVGTCRCKQAVVRCTHPRCMFGGYVHALTRLHKCAADGEIHAYPVAMIPERSAPRQAIRISPGDQIALADGTWTVTDKHLSGDGHPQVVITCRRGSAYSVISRAPRNPVALVREAAA